MEVIQLARPTKSLGLYLQQVGRGLRIAAGKRKVLFLDNVGLYNRFGFPASKRMWRKHYMGLEIEETSRFVSKEINEEPFEMKVYRRDLSEGCEKITLIESTGINEIVEDAKISYLLGREERLKFLIGALYENNRKAYEEFVTNYTEPNMSYTSELTEDLVNPCTYINCECEDISFWKQKIKNEFKPILVGREIEFVSFQDLDDYIRTKSKMILSRFKEELRKSRIQLFDELSDYTAEQIYTFFAKEFGQNHIMTKKLEVLVQNNYGDLMWPQIVKLLDSPKMKDYYCNLIKNSPTDKNNTERINVGDRIIHDKWGSGTIVRTILKNRLYSVNFDNSSSDEIYVQNKEIKKTNEENGLYGKNTTEKQYEEKYLFVGDTILYQAKLCTVVDIKWQNDTSRLIIKYEDGTFDNVSNDKIKYTIVNRKQKTRVT